MDDYKNGYQAEGSGKCENNDESLERRNRCRRVKESKGYMYISMVGWMDRREYGRRTDDTIMFQ